jgi:hypothetical protein
MTTQIFTSKQLAIFGEFLRIAYSESPNWDRLTALGNVIISDADFTRALAFENRIMTNIVAIFVEAPRLFQILEVSQKLEFKRAYMENWRDAELIKRQLVELSDELQRSDASPILMIKGGLRLFDNLYPTVGHRYMADIDLFFRDIEVLKLLANLEYHADEHSNFDLSKTSQEYLNWQKAQDHHLPPVASPNHSRRLEMHQHLVHLRAVKYCRDDTIERGQKLDGLPKILAPDIVDQLILNLLHTKYGDMFTDYANFRLRNIFEGYQLFHQLSVAQQSEFEQHFSSIGKFDDVLFWKYLCLHLLGAQEFAGAYPLRIKIKFMLHARFGQNSRANAISYCIHFLYRFVGKELWSAEGRQILSEKMKDNEKRRIFWDKLARIFRR